MMTTANRRRLACLSIATIAAMIVGPNRGRAEEPLRETVDRAIAAAWKRENIQPAGGAEDAEFLRRVSLDLVGVIPFYEETVRFLEDRSPDKRAKLIDRLLEDPRFAQHQADVWDMVLFGRNPPGYQTDRRDGFQRWLREQFAKNTPYDQWVRTLLRAEGNTVEDGAPMFYVQFRNQPEDGIEAITQRFLGVQLQCARCHDHPFEPWSQTEFYGMAAFLARLRVVTVGKKNNETMSAIGEMNTGDVLFTGPVSEDEPGKKGQPVAPKFLRGEELKEPPLPKGVTDPRNFPSNKMPPRPKFSRKDALADWIARADNPYFAPAVANRVWAQFMGLGLVDPVDNMSPSNKPSHPELLAALTQGLIDHKFDLKWYIRELCNSRTYQLSSAGPVADARPEWFQRAHTRPLSAEELIASWRVALNYDVAAKGSRNNRNADRYTPLGSGYLLRFFGKPNDGMGNFQGGLHEHLYLNNGGLSQLMTTAKSSLHDTLSNSDAPWEERVDRLYLSLLNRPPRPAERQKFVTFLSAEKDSRDRLQQAIWVLMTCSEFRFNH